MEFLAAVSAFGASHPFEFVAIMIATAALAAAAMGNKRRD